MEQVEQLTLSQAAETSRIEAIITNLEVAPHTPLVNIPVQEATDGRALQEISFNSTEAPVILKGSKNKRRWKRTTRKENQTGLQDCTMKGNATTGTKRYWQLLDENEEDETTAGQMDVKKTKINTR